MDAPFTLRFDAFWAWLTSHPNCIVRAGTPEAVLYDDEDLYWHFGAEGPTTLLVQVLRGKRLVGELFVEPEQIAYVEAVVNERADEHAFELISETEGESLALYYFVLTHGWGEEDGAAPGRVH